MSARPSLVESRVIFPRVGEPVKGEPMAGVRREFRRNLGAAAPGREN
jgi:hypothetical protein